MSLLLKALQNAAKNREAASGPAGESGAPSDAKESTDELSLEPIAQPARAQSSTHSTGQPRNPSASQTNAAADEIAAEPTRGASPRHAQTVLRASAPKAVRPSIFSWIARRPLVAFSTAAGLFAIGYGTYLYLQLTNPGIFVASRPVAKAPVGGVSPPAQPPAVAPPPTVVPPAPAEVATAPGMAAAPAPALPSPSLQSVTGATSPPAPSAATAAAPASPPAAPAPSPTLPTAPAATAAPTTTSPPGAVIAVTPTQPPEPSAPAAKPRAPTPKVAAARPAAKPAPSEGIEPTSTAGQLVPVSASLASAYQALEKGQLDEAERMYRQSLSSDPRSTDAMLGLAATLTQQNRAAAASQFYLRVLEQDPRNAHAQAGLLNLAGRADPMAAEARLKQLIAREPSAFLYFSLGNLYSEQGQWAGAQAAYFQAHNLAPDNPDYAFNLAVGLEHLSQPKIALNYYRRALALAQSRGHSQFDSAKVQTRIRSLETALADKP